MYNANCLETGQSASEQPPAFPSRTLKAPQAVRMPRLGPGLQISASFRPRHLPFPPGLKRPLTAVSQKMSRNRRTSSCCRSRGWLRRLPVRRSPIGSAGKGSSAGPVNLARALTEVGMDSRVPCAASRPRSAKWPSSGVHALGRADFAPDALTSGGCSSRAATRTSESNSTRTRWLTTLERPTPSRRERTSAASSTRRDG
jgi:hypothetical protein